MKTKIIAAICLLFGLNISQAQISKSTTTTSELTYVKKLGVVNVSTQLKEIGTTAKKKDRADFKKPKNFIGRFPSNMILNQDQGHGPDKLRQTGFDPLRKKAGAEVIVNQDGLNSGGPPGDPSGDAGINHYMQAVNATDVGVYLKDGTLVQSFDANTLWDEVNRRAGGDPIILFDQEHSRWLITEFANSGNFLLIAISDTEDPLGEYSVYEFSTVRFPDYPKYAVWNEAYTITTNEQGSNQLTSYFLNREELIAGADEVRLIRVNIDGTGNSEGGFVVATPVDWSGKTKPPADQGPIVVALADDAWDMNQTEDQINVTTFTIDWDNDTAVSSTDGIPVSPYDSFPCAVEGQAFGFDCIPQANSNRGLDGLPEIITFQPHYRNFGTHESMVFSFVTDVTAGNNLAGIRWIEMRKTQDSGWDLFQEGTFAPNDGLHRFMSGIALDGFGNMALAYNSSGENDFQDIRITGRLATDPLGEMTLDEVILVEGENPINGGRSGDYTHLTIDPVDDITFWFTSEYPANNSTATRISSFKLQRPEFDILPTNILQPTATDLTVAEKVIVEVINGGTSVIENFSIGYRLDNNTEVIDQINISLEANEEYIHEFTQTIDLSAEGDHLLSVFTSSTQDQLRSNDTLTRLYYVQPAFDAAIEGFDPIIVDCGATETTVNIRVKNEGIERLESVSGTYMLNNGTPLPFDITTDLLSQQIESFPIIVNNLIVGNNTLEVRIESINGAADNFTFNNTVLINNILLGSELITIQLNFDDYPDETSWAITNEDDQVIAEGGPYEDADGFSTLETDVCVLDECYTFSLEDSFGDGLQAQGDPPGSYIILNQDGEQLAGLLDASFGSIESNIFCPSLLCNLDADIAIEDATQGFTNGSIMITLINGNGAGLTYSIDGGESFQSNAIFPFLASGEYDIVIRNPTNGCSFMTTVVVGDGVSVTEDIAEAKASKLFPNPTTGIFNVELMGYDAEETAIPIFIYSQEGKFIQRTFVSRYGESHKGMISLHHYPEGRYYLRCDLKENDLLLSIVKQ